MGRFSILRRRTSLLAGNNGWIFFSTRRLIAQSVLDGLLLVSNQAVFDCFGVKRLW
jgi:hypothetical protein